MWNLVKGRVRALCLSLSFTFFLAFFVVPDLITAESVAGRFFLMGDGKIEIRNTHTGKKVRVTLLNADGSLNEGAFAEIDEVFGFPAQQKGEHISSRLIFMLDYFSDLVAPGKTINLVSGYRSPQYNETIRNAGGNVASTSTHMDGMALDFNIEGVNGKELWGIIRSINCCGVGHYGGQNVHLDSARPRFWEAATSKVRTGESDYNRRIYLSTDYDRYRAGDAARLSFSSVSDFGFGIRPVISLTNDPEGDNPVATAVISARETTDCVMILDREASRFIQLVLPHDLRKGKYRVRVEFCRRTSDQMPLTTFSNEIEVAGQGP